MTSSVEVRRSTRRRRTVSAHGEGETVVVVIPARFTTDEERRWVTEMVTSYAGSPLRRRPCDDDLAVRAGELSTAYLGGLAKPSSVRWVAPMASRWGSCTPADRTIRVSRALRGAPGWVLDYLLVHELAHLLIPDHGAEFWALVRTYPKTERAIGYLQGFAEAVGGSVAVDGQDVDGEVPLAAGLVRASGPQVVLRDDIARSV